jgi:hypothetical protein
MAAVDDATTQFTALHLISHFDEHASKLCGIWERTLKHRTAAKLILKLDVLGVSSARTAAIVPLKTVVLILPKIAAQMHFRP